MKTRLIGFAAAAASVGAALALTAPTQAQPSATPAPKQEFVWPARISNAKALPADIGQERLRMTMVGFARSLGVRCTFCHVGPEGAPLNQLDFASDANPHKDIARGMIRMTRRLNAEDLTTVLGASDRQRVTCYTCHRGSSEPESVLPPPAPRPAAPPQPTPAPAQPHH